MASIDQYLGVGDVAKELKLHRTRVHQFLREGRLKGRKIAGRILISPTELERFAKIIRPTGKPPTKKKVVT